MGRWGELIVEGGNDRGRQSKREGKQLWHRKTKMANEKRGHRLERQESSVESVLEFLGLLSLPLTACGSTCPENPFVAEEGEFNGWGAESV